MRDIKQLRSLNRNLGPNEEASWKIAPPIEKPSAVMNPSNDRRVSFIVVQSAQQWEGNGSTILLQRWKTQTNNRFRGWQASSSTKNRALLTARQQLQFARVTVIVHIAQLITYGSLNVPCWPKPVDYVALRQCHQHSMRMKRLMVMTLHVTTNWLLQNLSLFDCM